MSLTLPVVLGIMKRYNERVVLLSWREVTLGCNFSGKSQQRHAVIVRSLMMRKSNCNDYTKFCDDCPTAYYLLFRTLSISYFRWAC